MTTMYAPEDDLNRTKQRSTLTSLAFPNPMVLPPAPPSTSSGMSITRVDPATDLRGTQISPAPSARQTTAQQQTDTAASRVAGFSGFTPFRAVSTTGSPYVQQAQSYGQQAAQSLGSGQIAPTNLSGVRQGLNLAGTLAGFQSGNPGLAYGADTQGVRSGLAAALAKLQGPDRQSLVARAFQRLREESEPGFQQELRQVGQKAAALGRLGAGMTTSDLGDVAQRRNEFLGRRMAELSDDAASQELADRLGVAGAYQGGFGTLAGADQAQADFGLAGANFGLQRAGFARSLAGDELDLARFSRQEGESDRAYGLQRGGFLSGLADQAFRHGQGLRGEERDERDSLFRFEQGGLDANQRILDQLGGREADLYGQERGLRDELRGERSYQAGQSQLGIDNAVRQRMLEEQLLSGSFGRAYDTAGLYDRLGYGGLPGYAGELGSQADRASAEADQAYGGATDVLGEYLLRGSPSTGMTPDRAADALRLDELTPRVTKPYGSYRR